MTSPKNLGAGSSIMGDEMSVDDLAFCDAVMDMDLTDAQILALTDAEINELLGGVE